MLSCGRGRVGVADWLPALLRSPDLITLVFLHPPFRPRPPLFLSSFSHRHKALIYQSVDCWLPNHSPLRFQALKITHRGQGKKLGLVAEAPSLDQFASGTLLEYCSRSVNFIPHLELLRSLCGYKMLTFFSTHSLQVPKGRKERIGWSWSQN